MRIKSAKFITSKADGEVDGFFPQICVTGRSNCGKSSLLNMLMGAKLARTSSTPGRTRLINIFELSADSEYEQAKRFFLVDLPGYGFYKAQRTEAEKWSGRTEKYFECGFNNIAQALCLMDVRREPSDLDKTLINYLRDMGYPFTVVLTKADKLSRVKTADAKIKIAAALGLARDNLIVTSSLDGTGRSELSDRIEAVLSAFDLPTQNT